MNLIADRFPQSSCPIHIIRQVKLFTAQDHEVPYEGGCVLVVVKSSSPTRSASIVCEGGYTWIVCLSVVVPIDDCTRPLRPNRGSEDITD